MQRWRSQRLNSHLLSSRINQFLNRLLRFSHPLLRHKLSLNLLVSLPNRRFRLMI
jgi:hypothetical protein